MFIKRVLIAAALCLLSGTARADIKTGQLTHFRPISQSEYEAILSLTDGKSVVSEGRLIQGGLAALAGMASGWVTSLRFSNIFGYAGAEQKPPTDSYPLCVIKSSDLTAADHHGEYHHHHHRRSADSQESLEDSYDHHLYQQHYASVAATEHDSHEHEGSYEVALHHNQHYAPTEHASQEHEGSYEVALHHNQHYAPTEHVSQEHEGSYGVTSYENQLAPVVNCIVVLKEEDQHEHEVDDDQYQTTTKRPKRPHKKHRVHAQPPPPHPEIHHYSAAPSAYPVHPPHGSYNSPWYWQSPQYNPYYSGPITRTAIYSGAYPGIFAANNPGTYPGAYPGAYSGTFATPAAGNYPYPFYNPYPSTFTGPASSAQPIIAYNSQPSGSAGNYPGVEIPINRQLGSPSANSNAIYNGQPGGGSTAPVKKSKRQPGSQAKKPTQINVNIAPFQSEKKDTVKAPLTTDKTKSKKAIKSQQETETPANQSPPADVSILTRRHMKAKRDDANAQSHSYTKIASYSESGYQPSLYPQNSYPSNYPKVSYTHALSYPAPVYVKNSIQQPFVSPKMMRAHANEADSEEDDNSTEFIQVRSNLRLDLN